MARVSVQFDAQWAQMRNIIKQQMISRAYRGAHELRNAAVDKVLKGQGHGRRYRVPSTKQYYTASAPGEPPANRTGVFRMSWHPNAIVDYTGGADFAVVSEIENKVTANGYNLGELLEGGTSKMAPRPHHEKIQNEALPNIIRIYNEPYL